MPAPDTVDPRADRRTAATSATLAQLAGVVGGPVFFLLGLHLLYAAVPWACDAGTRASLHVIGILAVLSVAACAWLSAREWRREGAHWPGEGGDPRSRGRFLAAVGSLLSAFLTLVALVQWVALLVFAPCAGT